MIDEAQGENQNANNTKFEDAENDELNVLVGK